MFSSLTIHRLAIALMDKVHFIETGKKRLCDSGRWMLRLNLSREKTAMNRNHQILILLLILTVLNFGCSPKATDEALVIFPPTEIGTPEGLKVTKEIGSAGGTLASPDGRLTLTVPQGALTETVAFSIQPITNKAGGGIGSAYRLEPDGKTFATPLQISVRYDDKDLEGTVPEALSLAYQDEKGAWRAQKSAKLSQDARTLTVSTTHFTDFAFLARVRLFPSQSTVYVGGFEVIEVVGCKERSFIDKISGRPSDCSSPEWIASWYLQGKGGIEALPTGTSVIYRAPAKKPMPNVAWVRVDADIEVWESETGTVTNVSRSFKSKITILDRGYRATGKTADVTYSGVICSLEKPFTVTGNNGLFLYPFKFVPSSASAGTASWTAKWKMASMEGSGSYTIEGADTDKPRIAWSQSGTGHIPVSSVSYSSTVYIDLVPLDTNECN